MTAPLPTFAPDSRRALDAVRRCPIHAPTPLRHLDVDGSSVLVKDESVRFGLGSFKALGGVYAVIEAMRERCADASGERPSIEAVFERASRGAAAPATTFVCASAGNHGIAVAAGAALLGARARIHLSDEVPEDFAERLRGRGAEVIRSGRTYEDSLAAAAGDAEDSEAMLIADTAWDGYVDVPARIMEGYTVVGEELRETFESEGGWPSDVYLQAGVGGLAGAMTWLIRRRWPVQPRIVIVEPEAAPCLAASHERGEPATVEGPVSSMGRLDCKSASPLAVDALLDADVDYLALGDAAAEKGASVLAAHGVRTTPSGAAGFAAWQVDRERGACVGDRPLVIVSEEALHE